MPDILIQLPASFKYLNQFVPTPSTAPLVNRSMASSLAMAAELVFPGRDVPEELERIITASSSAEALDWLTKYGITFIDLQPLVEEFQRGNAAALHGEIMAQNSQQVAQIISVADESKLFDDTGKKLHSWADTGQPHTMLRVGYSTDQGYGLYFEPAAPGFAQPVHIPWTHLVEANVSAAVAILPGGVEAPPAGFSFQSGQWPTPKPTLNLPAAQEALHILEQVIQTMASATTALKEAFPSE